MLRIAVVFGIIAVSTILVAYTSFDSGIPPLPEDDQGRGAFVFAVPNDPGKLDPSTTSASSDFRVVKLLYEPLLVVPWGGGIPEPGTAAAMPEISADGLTYTFSIRDDARWSDNTPVFASDFVYGWRRALLPDSASEYASLLYLIDGAQDFYYFRQGLLNFATLQESITEDEARQTFLAKFPNLEQLSNTLSAQEKWDLTLKTFDEMVGIRAIGERTLEVRLKAPTAYFIDLCAFPTFSPMPAHVLEQYAELSDDGYWRVDETYFGDPDRLLSNGAYYLRDRQQKVRIIFDQNPYYWNRDAMGNIRVVEETIQDTNLQVLQYEEGMIDWIPDVGAIAQDLIPAGYPDIHPIPVAGTYYYHFNCRPTLPNGVPNPMADARVRRAMAMCINRQQIVDNVTQMSEPVARLIVPYADIPGYTGPEEAGIRYDPQAARALLAEAGYPNGEGFPTIEILVNNDSGPSHTNIALVIEQEWEQDLGITVNIEAIEFKVLLDRSANGNFFVRRAGWFGDYADPTTWLDMHRSEDSNNHGAYYNEDFERLLREAALELDRDARFELLRQAEAILIHDAPIVPLYYYVNVMIYDEDKIDLRPNAWNNLRLEMIPIQRGEDE